MIFSPNPIIILLVSNIKTIYSLLADTTLDIALHPNLLLMPFIAIDETNANKHAVEY